VSIYESHNKALHIVIWLALTVAGFNVRAAKEPLGAVLMKQQRFAEAEQVYRDDLARLPENGWSLLGLAESLRKQKKNADEIAQTQTKFEKVWAKADLTITTSCLCQPQA
jgi:predicted Zn-dependent protease